MRRLLVISPYFPCPVTSGSSVRLARVLEYWRSLGYRVHLVLAVRKPRKCRRPADLFERIDRLTLLDLAGYRVPGINTGYLEAVTQPRSSSLGRAWQRLVRHASGAGDIRRVVARIVARQQPDVLWLDHTYLAPLVADVRGDASLKIVDTHDVMHVRDATLRAAGLPAESGVTAEQERDLLAPFDAVVAIQREERGVLESLLAGTRIITVGHAADIDPQPCTRPSICFVGSSYVVNVECILRFMAAAWPRIRQQSPHARLEIVGSVCRDRRVAAAAAADSGIVLRGVVPQTRDIYHGPAAVVCPLWMGSGLKIKAVEALAHGKPTVATPLAAAGLEDAVGRGLLLANRPEDFVQPCVDLLSQPRLCRGTGAAAADFARDRFRPSAVFAELDELIARFHRPPAKPLSAPPRTTAFERTGSNNSRRSPMRSPVP